MKRIIVFYYQIFAKRSCLFGGGGSIEIEFEGCLTKQKLQELREKAVQAIAADSSKRNYFEPSDNLSITGSQILEQEKVG